MAIQLMGLCVPIFDWCEIQWMVCIHYDSRILGIVTSTDRTIPLTDWAQILSSMNCYFVA